MTPFNSALAMELFSFTEHNKMSCLKLLNINFFTEMLYKSNMKLCYLSEYHSILHIATFTLKICFSGVSAYIWVSVSESVWVHKSPHYLPKQVARAAVKVHSVWRLLSVTALYMSQWVSCSGRRWSITPPATGNGVWLPGSLPMGNWHHRYEHEVRMSENIKVKNTCQ